MCSVSIILFLGTYRGADKFLARPDWKKTFGRSPFFRPDAEDIVAAETWLDGQICEFLGGDLQKSPPQNSESRCSLFPSRSG